MAFGTREPNEGGWRVDLTRRLLASKGTLRPFGSIAIPCYESPIGESSHSLAHGNSLPWHADCEIVDARGRYFYAWFQGARTDLPAFYETLRSVTRE